MKKIGFVLAALALLVPAAASAEVIRIEGEDFSQISCDNYIVEKNQNFSKQKALFINSVFKLDGVYRVDYTINAPESGMYAVEGVISRYNAYYTADICFSVNDGPTFTPDFVQQSLCDWWVQQRGDYGAKYTLGNVRLNKGVNKFSVVLREGDVKVDLPLYTALVDYLDFSPVSPDFQVTKIEGVTEAANLFRRGDEIKLKMDFSNSAPKGSGFDFKLEDVWGQTIKESRVTFEEGSTEYIMSFGSLPVGWYRMTFSNGAFADKLTDEFYFSVVAPVSDLAEENTRFTIESGIGYVKPDYQKKFIKSMEWLGVKEVREGTDPGPVLKDDTYLPSHYGLKQNWLHNSGIKILNVYEHFTWMNYKDLPTDLMEVYKMHKKLASYNEGTGDEYEIWNEQDGSFLYEPADKYSSYHKAAALGISDGASDALVSFGGLAGSREDPFDRLMLANDVMSYSDYYSYHAHIDSGRGLKAIDYPQGKALGHVIMANAYNNDKPVWMNEGGISIPVDENNVAYRESQLSQARYYIVSNAQAMAMGDDKRSWFRLGYFMEHGNTYGCHSENMCPYVVVNSISAFTNVMGKGTYKGELANLPEGAEGYVFDSGKGDVAVIWCKNEDAVEFNSNSRVKVTNFVGGEAYSEPNGGKVRVPVSYYPVFVSFDGEMDKSEYIPQSYKNKEEKRTSYSENDRIVIQQEWDDENLSKARSNGYMVDWDEKQKIKVRVYNFNETPQSGTLTIKTGSNILASDVLVPDMDKIEFSVPAMSVMEYPVTVSLSDKAKMGDAGYFMIEGMLADGRKLSPTKARFTTSNVGRTVEDYTLFEDYENPGAWDTTNVGDCKAVITHSDEEDALQFHLKFNKLNWAWPRIDVKDSNVLAGTQGITFKVKNAVKGQDNMINVFVYYADGTNYWLAMGGHFATTDEWTQVVIPWKSFVNFYTALGNVDTRGFVPELITKIGIGSDSQGLEQKFYVKDFGYYRSDCPADLNESGGYIEIDGPENGAEYDKSALSDIKIKLPPEASNGAKIMLNEETIRTTEPGEDINLDLSNLERGKYRLEAAALDSWGDASTTWATFYVK